VTPLASVMGLVFLGAVAGCAGYNMQSGPSSPNASSADCQAAGGATYDSESRVCIGVRR